MAAENLYKERDTWERKCEAIEHTCSALQKDLTELEVALKS